jgi:hypothetical protein
VSQQSAAVRSQHKSQICGRSRPLWLTALAARRLASSTTAGGSTNLAQQARACAGDTIRCECEPLLDGARSGAQVQCSATRTVAHAKKLLAEKLLSSLAALKNALRH